jgi:hypothetical protein
MVAIVAALCAAGAVPIALMAVADPVLAHCDTMSGPVIPEALAALEQGDITPVLKWIKPEHEAELKAAFDASQQVRSKGAEARALADRHFLETLVRLHRAGEGAPYTGLKDTPPEEIAILADQALANGSADQLVRDLQNHLAAVLMDSFNAARQASQSKGESVAAGREFVEAYIHYMHYVEGLHAAIVSAGAHGEEPPQHDHE